MDAERLNEIQFEDETSDRETEIELCVEVRELVNEIETLVHLAHRNCPIEVNMITERSNDILTRYFDLLSPGNRTEEHPGKRYKDMK